MYKSKLSIIPCRAEGSDKSEMVTQLLYGELFDIIEKFEKWVKIKVIHDSYICYIDIKQFKLSEKIANNTQSGEIMDKPFSNFNTENEAHHIFAGSYITNYKRSRKTLKEYALEYLNAPYLWGGRTISGIDCSGFSQLIYRLIGIDIPRDAYQQAELGENVAFITEAKTGDLAFFDNQEGKITHVGIVFNHNENIEIIHASGKVRIDKLDHNGIFNITDNEYSHKLRVIKKYY